MKTKTRKNTKQKPVWIYRDGEKEYPVTLNALIEMFETLFDETLIAGDEHMTMFLMDMMQAFREGKPIRKEFGMIARHKWLSELQ